jgi:iron complex outermembrane receptor protein
VSRVSKCIAYQYDVNKLEKSYGFNFDVNYRTNLTDELSLSVNQLFFTRRLMIHFLTPLANDSFQFINVNGNLNTKGTETNLKLGIKISNYS